MTQKGLALIVIILILAGGVVLFTGGYFLGKLNISNQQSYQSNNQNPVITSTTKQTPTPQPTTTITPTPTIDETANWKTYVHPLKFLSFKLPSEWKKDKNSYSQNPLEFDDGQRKMEIYIDTTPISLKDFVAQEKKESIELHGDIIAKSWSETTVLLDKQDAIKVKTSNPGFTIYTKDHSQAVIVSITFYFDDSNLTDQILSAFKFTN